MDAEELRLERQRLRIDTQLRRAELKLKREQAAGGGKEEPGWKVFSTPTGAAIAAGIIALCGTAAGKWFDVRIENKKAETDIIMKASDVPTELDDATRAKVRARNIIWFYQAGYISIPNQDFLKQLYVDGGLKPNEIPSAPEVQSAVPVTTGSRKVSLDDSERKRLGEAFTQMTVRPEWEGQVAAAAQRITAARERYETVGREFGIPWQVIGVLHWAETSGSFDQHLHNGDPLTARTFNPPKGRPTSGNPPFTWEESAKDAIVLDGINRNKDWSIPGTLYFFEKYNGWGYRLHGVNTPYVWSGSDQYTAGRYTPTGAWSDSAVSRQVGVAPLLRKLSYTGTEP